MLLSILLVGISGIIAGGIINMLADELPYRRNPALPVYPDGTPRKPIAWLGITAFLFNRRTPTEEEQAATSEAYKIARQRGGFRWEDDEEVTQDFVGEPKLTWRYPLTEIVTALLMVAANIRMTVYIPETSATQQIAWLILTAILVLITIIDLEHKLILFVVMIPSCVFAILLSIFANNFYIPTLRGALIGAGLGFGIFFALYLGGIIFTNVLGRIRGEEISVVAFGFGDVMLITLAGLTLGFNLTVLAIFIAVFLGAFGALAYMVFKFVAGERYRMYTALPYGPYIVVAVLLLMYFPAEVQHAMLNYCAPSPPLVC